MGEHEHEHTSEAFLDEDFWNERYQESGRIWSGKPNPQLVAEVAGLVSGRALDVGCGEGDDAIWLAQHGWDVVATDISAVALGRAIQHAQDTDRSAWARIEWRHVDLLTDPPDRDSFDLVSAQFMQLPPEPRARSLLRARRVHQSRGNPVGGRPPPLGHDQRGAAPPDAGALLHGGRHRWPARPLVDRRRQRVPAADGQDA